MTAYTGAADDGWLVPCLWLCADLHTLAKWFCLLHTMHFLPLAGQSFGLCAVPPQYLHVMALYPCGFPRSLGLAPDTAFSGSVFTVFRSAASI